jgi:ectoine hydroxylase-related dioxygenase (phytanoyl-CoA dioxygenase family)
MFKPARHGGIKPWHQDYAYWASLKPEQVTCWMALDEATPENGCMQLIPGSHKWGLVKHIREELQVDPKNLPMEMVKIAPMKPGSILCFHVLTFHYSGPNTSDKSRRALIVDYDPNKRPVKGGFAGDKVLRIDGRKPTPEEVAESIKVNETVAV